MLQPYNPTQPLFEAFILSAAKDLSILPGASHPQRTTTSQTATPPHGSPTAFTVTETLYNSHPEYFASNVFTKLPALISAYIFTGSR